jgi:D-alanyl-D-alanine carboxypeptidase-like protein
VPRRFKLALLAVFGLLAVAATAAIALSLQDDQPRPAIQHEDGVSERPPEAPTPVLVVRRRGGVPSSWARRLRRAPGVSAVAVTERTQALMRASRRAGGPTVDRVPEGYAIPLDVMVVQPREYADVLHRGAAEIRRLRRGTALLSRSSARLRRLAEGDRLALAGGRRLRIAGTVDDELVGFAEVVLTRSDTGAGNQATRQLLVATERPERVARRLGRSDAVRVRTLSPSLRTSPRLVARPLEIKARFGEFAVGLPYDSDWIRIEPRWLDRNIVTRSVPILGAVTCNRRIVEPLRRALRSLEQRGLSNVVDRADYAGCFAPRRIPGSGSLSLHAWGLAIDINAAANPRLGDSRQDRRLVRAMEAAGFTWGGRWPTVPDPMHFELHP